MTTNSSTYGTSFPNLSADYPKIKGTVCNVPKSTLSGYVAVTQTTSESGYYKDPAHWLPNNNPNNIAQPTTVPTPGCYIPPYKELTIKCPTCNGGQKQVIVNQAGKKYIDLTDQVTRWPQAVRKLVQGIDDLVNGIITVADVNDRWFKKVCPTCHGLNIVEDPTGQTGFNAEKAAIKYKEIAQPLTEQEQIYGDKATGNRYTIVANYDVLDVGAGMNNNPSYRIDPSGHAPGHIGTDVPQVVVHHKSPVVQGTQPASTPGGHYAIKCSNKFTCLVGAQGIDIATHGPINITGGQTKISGPDVTIGSSTGPVNISGHHLQLTGQTLSIRPVGLSAQAIVQGTMGVTGNIVVGGGVHVDGDLSFTSATVPSKMVRTKYSSDWSMNTAMATWAGPAERRLGAPPLGYENVQETSSSTGTNANSEIGQALTFETENYTRSLVAMTNDPSKLHETYRGFMTVADHNAHLAYLLYTTEWQPTGVCMAETFEKKELKVYSKPGGKGKLVGYVKIDKMPMYNYPHQHQLFDGWHTHEMEVPNINLLDTADEVRKVSSPKALPVPFPAIRPTDLYLMKLGPLVE